MTWETKSRIPIVRRSDGNIQQKKMENAGVVSGDMA
jgi:hypothetical protein